jgi:predicted MPP superfamily phosphohydrolase
MFTRLSTFFMRQLLIVLFCAAGLSTAAQSILVMPYIQPGNVSTFSKEQKVVIWQTDSIPATFFVEFSEGPIETTKKISTAKVSSAPVNVGGHMTLLYRAVLTGLKFDAEYGYRVRMEDKVIGSAIFTTRTKKASSRFAVFGDCGTGSTQQKAIAYQVSLQKPEFVLVTGDNVYNSGLAREYLARFFSVYLFPEASQDMGAPLMRSVPFYMILGNHDVQAFNLDKFPDGLAYFYYNDTPLNAPQTEVTVEARGQPAVLKAFEKGTGGRYPKAANYSFDHGNVHIVCLDANAYANPLDPSLVDWLRSDLRSTKAGWKIVSYHHPGFNSSKAHYDYQLWRLLSPLLEELGVDLVLNGHVHNYQRSVPLKFAPKRNKEGDQYIITPEGRIDGMFTLDQQFDGVTNTKAKGIIYVVSGAGGAALYDPALSGQPELWKHEPSENWVPFTAKIISDIHSFTMIETEGKKLTLRQMDGHGAVIDAILITK